MVLAVGDNAVTYYRQLVYNANRPARHPATMTGHRQPEFAIGKVLVRLKVTRLMWECNRASFVDPTELSTLFCGKTAILRQSPLLQLSFSFEFRSSTADTLSRGHFESGQ